MVKVGRYPLHHGTLGAIRSLGRVGIPVYAITEDPFTPAALSRYLRGHVVWPTSGREKEECLAEGLADVGRRIGQPIVAIATDDEAAVLLAEFRTELAEWFLLPPVSPALPRSLASKRGLHEICERSGVAVPKACLPSSLDDVRTFADQATFPAVVKNGDPWARLRAPAVLSTTVVASAEDLLSLAARWPSRANVILQEYIPRADAEDWVFHGYFDGASNCIAGFTGVKLRSWPPHAGVTTYGCAVTNTSLAAKSSAFCKLLGYSGIVDLDWRFDRRDGRYKLLDFNPRLGAQFRLFENEAGIDVVRATHLDLTGRKVPPAPQVDGRRLVVEHLDAPARLAYRRPDRCSWAAPKARGKKALAWTAFDDPLPFLAMGVRTAWHVARRLAPLAGMTRRSQSRQADPRPTIDRARTGVPQRPVPEPGSRSALGFAGESGTASSAARRPQASKEPLAAV
jgi:predicted ATP-grasp superfamily ATP-dependent carboligase